MRTLTNTLIALALGGSSLLVAAPAQAAAVPGPAPAGASYGQHVSACARTMGFDGSHNPGTHHGRAGWDPNHACLMP